jgi:hypothetical protein
LKAAQRRGLVLDEITATDVAIMMWSVRGVIETTSAVAPRAWRRHLELLLAGIRPAGSTPAILTEKPLTPAEYARSAVPRGSNAQRPRKLRDPRRPFQFKGFLAGIR